MAPSLSPGDLARSISRAQIVKEVQTRVSPHRAGSPDAWHGPECRVAAVTNCGVNDLPRPALPDQRSALKSKSGIATVLAPKLLQQYQVKR